MAKVTITMTVEGDDLAEHTAAMTKLGHDVDNLPPDVTGTLTETTKGNRKSAILTLDAVRPVPPVT